MKQTAFLILAMVTMASLGAAALQPGDSAGPGIDELIAAIRAKGYRLDLSAYEGLPRTILHADLRYLSAAVGLVEGRLAVIRRDYRLLNGKNSTQEDRELYWKRKETSPPPWLTGPFPGDIGVLDEGPAPLPVKLLPSPARLRVCLEKLTPGERRKLKIPDLTAPFEQLIRDCAAHARGVYFESGWRSDDGNHGCPMSGEAGCAGGAYRETPGYFAPAELGKLVGRVEQLVRPQEQIRLGKWLGAKLLGRMNVVGITSSVYFVEVDMPGEAAQRYITYPIADGNSGLRGDRPWIDPEKGGRAENSVRSPVHDPRLGRHSLLKIPRPFKAGPYPPGQREYQQERISVGPGFAGQEPPIVVLRKDAAWKPFLEDYVLDNRLSFTGEDADTARLVCVFTNISPKGLLRLIGALHGTDVSRLKGDAAVLERLEKLRPCD